jgi:hypothetical protein
MINWGPPETEIKQEKTKKRENKTGVKKADSNP